VVSRAVIVGGGHNGLIAACYLARAGLAVTVLEQADAAGGGSRTEETVPGFRFDTHSAAHNIINMTEIPAELDLAAAGLTYREMDPFAAGFLPDGRVVRFHRSVDATIASIAEHEAAEARRYGEFIERAMPAVEVATAGLTRATSGPAVLRAGLARLGSARRAVRRAGGVGSLVQDVLAPYGGLLAQTLDTELVRAPIAAFAAHGAVGPSAAGGGFFALWQAAYHRFGQWHAVGGAQALTDALVTRLGSFGGRLRTGAAVRRIATGSSGVTGVELEDGERIAADVVVTAMDPATALLTLLDPPLSGPAGRRLAGVHRSNTVQMVVHLATTALPAYPGARAGDWNGLQSLVDSLDDLADAFRQGEAGYLPDNVPTYAFTPSAIDDTLAPPGQHTVYLACPSAPFRVRGGWAAHGEAFADAMVEALDKHAPGFAASVVGRHVRTPELMAAELRWPGAHPMIIDITPDQLSFLRPTPQLSGHRTPVPGLFVSGGGTAPTAGIAGVPGQAAALAVLRTQRGRRRGRRGEG